MKPILYSHSETTFTNNGLGRLADCVSCIVTEERNGIYECVLVYPVTGDMYPKIKIGCILGVIHDDAKDIQPFDIYAKDAPINGLVTFYAHHVCYRLGHVILKPFSASSITAALAGIPYNTYNSCPFTFWTDKSVSGTWKIDVPSAVKAILGGETGSILDIYGKGEYEWDRFAVKLHLNRGNDNGVAIRYGVNLTDIKQDYDILGTYNAVAPFWKTEEGVVTLTEGYITASSVQSGDEIVPVPMDLSSSFQEQPTEAQLRAEALRILDNSKAWIPDENISVRFIDLAHTEEYKDVAALQRVRLCDKVSVYCGPLGVEAVKMQVIKVVYNVLTESYDEIELGNAKTSFSDTLMAKVEKTIVDLTTRGDVQYLLQQAIENATKQITGAQSSHVRFIYDANGSMQEIVVMDTDSITTATKVWRWNSAGLGFSSNGYAGPYALAMTQDGAIVADFITSGTLTANLIRAGILQDVAGKNFWNLVTGEFQLASTTTVGGSTVNTIAANAASGAVDGQTQQSIFKKLTNNGQTQGIYLKNGKLYINASYMDTGTLNANLITSGGISGTKIANGAISTDKLAANAVTAAKIAADAISASMINAGTMLAERIKGGTLTLGGQNNTNGVLRINDSSGNKIGGWDNSGIQLSKGNISFPKDGQISCNFSSDGQSYIKISGDYQSSSGYEKAYGMRLKVQNATAELTAYSETEETTGEVDLNISDYIPQFLMNGGGFWTDDCSLLLSPVAIRLVQNSDTLLDIHVEEFNPDTGFPEFAYMKWNAEFECSALYCRNTKSRIVSTDQYSDRLLYCYETSTPMFGDIGDGVISEDGLCYVMLDAIFAQTISTNQYQVFLQKYGSGDCWVRERKGAYFIVEGTPGLQFGWEVKAKQRDYDQLRLERNDIEFKVPAETYGESAAQHIDALRKGMILQ